MTHGIIRCLDFFAKHVICLIQCEVDNALTAYWNTRGVIARSRQCDAAVFLCRRGVWPAGDPVTRTDRRDVVGAASALMHRASSRTERMSSQRHWPRLVVYPASRVSREFLQMHYYFQCPPPEVNCLVTSAYPNFDAEYNYSYICRCDFSSIQSEFCVTFIAYSLKSVVYRV